MAKKKLQEMLNAFINDDTEAAEKALSEVLAEKARGIILGESSCSENEEEDDSDDKCEKCECDPCECDDDKEDKDDEDDSDEDDDKEDSDEDKD